MKTKQVVAFPDVSRYGWNVYENGWRVLGTWSMAEKRSLEIYRRLGDKRRLDKTGARIGGPYDD